MPENGLQLLSVKYLLGNLALSNLYAFAVDDIFKFSEGVYGSYKSGQKVFILLYDSNEKSKEAYLRALEHISGSEYFSGFNMNSAFFSMQDQNSKLIFITRSDQYLILVVGAKDIQTAKILSDQI